MLTIFGENGTAFNLEGIVIVLFEALEFCLWQQNFLPRKFTSLRKGVDSFQLEYIVSFIGT